MFNVLLVDAQGATAAEAQAVSVTTLSYAGRWIEMLQGTSARACALLARSLVEGAKVAGQDEVGYLCPAGGNSGMRDALLSEGFVDSGDYVIYRER